MTTAQETLTKHGISLESYKAGRYYAPCPRCSHTRSREHQKNKVLGITIGEDGSVCWGYNHCAWSGGSGERQERRELTSSARPIAASSTVQPGQSSAGQIFPRMRAAAPAVAEGGAACGGLAISWNPEGLDTNSSALSELAQPASRFY
jgi:hypothetical protein